MSLTFNLNKIRYYFIPFLMLCSVAVNASHFRGGSLSWQATELDGDGLKNDVEITVKTAWRYSSPSSPTLQETHSGGGASLAFTQISNVVDYINGTSSGADYALRTTIFTASNLDPDISYLVFYTSGDRISNLQNNADGTWKIQTSIFMKDGNLAPIIDLPIIYEVPKLQADGSSTLTDYTFSVSVTDPNADQIRYRLGTTDELGGGSNPAGISIDTNTGLFTWTDSGTTGDGLFSVSVVVEDVDSDGAIKSKSQADFILDLINKAAIEYTVSGNVPASRSIIVPKGDTFSFQISGTNVSAGSLGTIQGALTEPSTDNFTFAPGNSGDAVDLAAGTYPVTIAINDLTSARTKSYLFLNFIVPNPNAPKIADIEGDTTTYSSANAELIDVSLDSVVTDNSSSSVVLNHLDNGYLRFNLTFTDGSYEVLGIESEGDAAGQIRQTGLEVFYEGSKIGDVDPFEDGIGRALRVDFGSASLAAVQSLVRNLTYKNTFLLRASGQRSLSLLVQDEDGENTNYSLTVDVQIHPNKPNSGSPTLVNNSYKLTSGDTTTISTNNISFLDADTTADNIVISVTGISQGQFELLSNAGVAITSFTQEQVNLGQVQFVHDGSESPPIYSLTASDGSTSLGPLSAAITFTGTFSDFVSVFEGSTGVLVVTSNNVVGTPTFNITGVAADNGAFTMDAQTGRLIFDNVPDFENPGDADNNNVYLVEATVVGSTSGTDLRAVTITVMNLNENPIISGSPASSISVNGAYSFTPTASDPDGDPLTFSITNRPSWMSFNTANGALTGTPLIGDAGSHNDILISVSDGNSASSTSVFSVTVTSNQAPTITGTPSTSVAENAAYSFAPTGADADGDSLTYSISNIPGWASFSTTTGALTGTPSYTDAGTESGIQISVTDGTATT
ncbi:MAG: hypothetical protein KUG82_15810, partial [Pseudomonadales bacterium]|nr:hypothetical protein [Pseudomonadales bacterium]